MRENINLCRRLYLHQCKTVLYLSLCYNIFKFYSCHIILSSFIFVDIILSKQKSCSWQFFHSRIAEHDVIYT